MLKIQAYYRTEQDLEKANEPYKSVAIELDKLYFKGPIGKSVLSYNRFKNTKAISCIRYIAEDLEKSQVSFISRLRTLWDSLINPQKLFSDSYDCYSVPYERYQGTIFGGVYYVLSKLKTVDSEHLNLIDSFVSDYSEAQPYFNVFKNALIGDIRPLAPKPSIIAAYKTTDIAILRKQFIQSLNNNPVPIEAVDWADATVGFDRKVMTELFWGIDDDKILMSVVKAIINTWNKLLKARDNRCLEVANSGGLAINIDPWKFGGLTKETIDKFFDNLWVERNARNTYAAFGIEKKTYLPKDQPALEKDLSTNEIKVKKEDVGNKRGEIEQLREKLATAIRDKEIAAETIKSLQNDLQAFKTKDKKGKEFPLFTVKQVAIFLKALLLEHNSLTNNSKNLTPLLQRFGGWAPTTAENALGYEVTQNECDDLEIVFNKFAPKIGSIIKKYPDKFKKIKEEKLQNNLKK